MEAGDGERSFIIDIVCCMQVPALLDHISAFDRCGKGVGYALLVVVPTFYVISAILFAVLGVVIHYWDKRQSGQASYTIVKNEDS